MGKLGKLNYIQSYLSRVCLSDAPEGDDGTYGTQSYPNTGDFPLNYEQIFPDLIDSKESGRTFNPAIQYHKGKLLTILRFNKMDKEIGSVYMKNKSYYVKNNTLIASVIEKSSKEPYIYHLGVLLDPFTDLLLGSRDIDRVPELETEVTEPSHYDCESTPDWLDGGHGPQDPRIFEFANNYYMIFNSRKQETHPNIKCPENSVQRKIYISGLETDWMTGLITGWYRPISLNLKDEIDVPWKRNGDRIDTAERNWLPFTCESLNTSLNSSLKEMLFMVYSLSPLIILKVNLQTGDCFEYYRTEVDDFKLDPIRKDLISKGIPKIDISNMHISPHGGSPLVKVPNRNYLLGVLHIHYSSPTGHRIYVNYPFKFKNIEPFEILKIGKALPLNSTVPEGYLNLSKSSGPRRFRDNYKIGSQISFVSDLTVWEEKDRINVAISYGAGDAIPRIFFTSVEELESEYFLE